MLQLKSEINVKVDNVMCWEYKQYTITINDFNLVFLGEPFDTTKPKDTEKYTTQYNSINLKQLNTINTINKS